MLKSEDLAREGFEEILGGAVGEIAKLYPAWTDHNTADPGIMILELMSYLSEVQRYHLNFLQKGHYLRYLKLLGMAPKPMRPSKTYLKLSGGGYVPARTRFYADELPFETEFGCSADDNEVLSLKSGDEALRNEGGILSERAGGFGRAAFYPFGHEAPKDGAYPEFVIKTRVPVKAGAVLGVYFAIGQTERFTPIRSKEDMTISLGARIGGENAGILLDETMGFSESGVILLKAGNVSADEIVFSVSGGEFSVLPVVTRVILNVTPALQKETLGHILTFDNVRNGELPLSERPDMLLSVYGERRAVIRNFHADDGKLLLPEEKYARIEAVYLRGSLADNAVIGTADGTCGQRVKTGIENILPEELAVYIDEDDGVYKWEVVPDFDDADKFTRCCVYDEETSELVFGNGRKGRPPRGVIRLPGCAVSFGEGGNVKDGMVNSTDERTSVSAENILPSAGGSARQSIDDCFAEARRRISAPECCVTLADYENAVRNTAGVPIKRVKAFVSEGKENVVCIALECLIGAYSDHGDHGGTPLMRNIRRNLLPRVPVGTKVEFPNVRYAGVNIFISVSVSLYYSDHRERTEKALRGYLGSGVNFGDTIGVNDISRYVCGLPWISGVKSVDLSVSASDGERLSGGDIRLKNVCLPIANKITVTVSG